MEGFFTSESVSEGHPDKLADQIADGVLDATLAQDPHARVACDVLVKNKTVVVAGEITTSAQINFEDIVHQVAKQVGYNDPFNVITEVSQQSADISRGIDKALVHDQGAGDQGIVVGYACNETDVLMPAPILFAHRLMQRQAEVRKSGHIPWLGPDAKSQLTFRYKKDKPVEITSVVLSTQHSPEIDLPDLKKMVMEEIIKPTLPPEWLTKNTQYFINPTGRFVIGGPMGDCGLTGRKIVVDSYGSMARDGGGCYSGKDPSKVDRSGAYAARYVAKNIVAAGLASRFEIQIAYAIGIAEPLAIHIDTFGTGTMDDNKILRIIKENFDLRPYSIIHSLNLLRPIYLATAAYGHFGRPEFSWEQTDKAKDL